MSKIQDNTDWGEREAKAIAGLLDERASRLSMRTIKQLDDARQKAVSAHQGHANGQGTLALHFPWLRQSHMIAAGLVCAAMILTLATNKPYNNEEGDAFILGADLPPEAFVDRGFEPWLNAKKMDI